MTFFTGIFCFHIVKPLMPTLALWILYASGRVSVQFYQKPQLIPAVANPGFLGLFMYANDCGKKAIAGTAIGGGGHFTLAGKETLGIITIIQTDLDKIFIGLYTNATVDEKCSVKYN